MTMKLGDEKFLRAMYDLKYLFGDKWALAIMFALSDGPLRRVDILSTVKSYSIGKEWSDKNAVLHDSILARTLKKMTEEGLLTRSCAVGTFPPKVTYTLRPEVLELLKRGEALVEWTVEHPEIIAQAQAYSRNAGSDLGTLTGIAGPDDDGDVPDDDELSDQD
jgi:DNA-binding HxlR family transcriptional regulator